MNKNNMDKTVTVTIKDWRDFDKAITDFANAVTAALKKDNAEIKKLRQALGEALLRLGYKIDDMEPEIRDALRQRDKDEGQEI